MNNSPFDDMLEALIVALCDVDDPTPEPVTWPPAARLVTETVRRPASSPTTRSRRVAYLPRSQTG